MEGVEHLVVGKGTEEGYRRGRVPLGPQLVPPINDAIETRLLCRSDELVDDLGNKGVDQASFRGDFDDDSKDFGLEFRDQLLQLWFAENPVGSRNVTYREES